MKRILAILLALMVVFAIGAVSVAADEYQVGTYVISVGDPDPNECFLNVRAGLPGDPAYETILCQVWDGTEVNVIEVANTDWGKIEVDGQTGWIRLKNYTTFVSAPVVSEEESSVEESTDASAEESVDVSVEESTDASVDTSVEASAEESVATSTEESVATSTEESATASAEESAAASAEESKVVSAEESKDAAEEEGGNALVIVIIVVAVVAVAAVIIVVAKKAKK